MTLAKIEIRSRNVELVLYAPFKGDAQHLFLIHTNSIGKETLLRGGPENKNMVIDNLKVIKVPYEMGKNGRYPVDWAPNAPFVVIATGTDIEIQSVVDKMWARGQEINNSNYDYKLPIPGCPPTVCHVQNSNIAVSEMVKVAGLKLELPKINNKPVWAPGIEGKLKHTEVDEFLKQYKDNFDQFMQGEGYNEEQPDLHPFMMDIEDIMSMAPKFATKMTDHAKSVIDQAFKLAEENKDQYQQQWQSVMDFAFASPKQSPDDNEAEQYTDANYANYANSYYAQELTGEDSNLKPGHSQ